jgi:hypothetical protein
MDLSTAVENDSMFFNISHPSPGCFQQQDDSPSGLNSYETHPFRERVPMVKRRVFDNEKHVYFVTFSCYKRRNFLQQDQAKRIVIGQLGSRLAKHDGLCTGFVIMPDHVQCSGLVSRSRSTQSVHEQVEGPVVTRD